MAQPSDQGDPPGARPARSQAVQPSGCSEDLLAGRRLYLCTSDRPDLARFVASCVNGGVDVVQLRDKHLEARPLLARAAGIAALCRRLGALFILNDRPDLALGCAADGVHVGQDDVPPELARQVLGPSALIGLSTHRPEEWDQAVSKMVRGAAQVNYLSVGPVHPTPTKPGRPGTGLGYVRYVASTPSGRQGGVPWFVTGGVTPETVPAMAAAGARRFVVVRYLTASADPEGDASRLREAIDREAAW